MAKQYVIVEMPDSVTVAGDALGGFVTLVSKEGFRVITESRNMHVIEGDITIHGDNSSENGNKLEFSGAHLSTCKPLSLAMGMALHKEAARLLEVQSLIGHIRQNLITPSRGNIVAP